MSIGILLASLFHGVAELNFVENRLWAKGISALLGASYSKVHMAKPDQAGSPGNRQRRYGSQPSRSNKQPRGKAKREIAPGD
jgi:hypothetical protein